MRAEFVRNSGRFESSEMWDPVVIPREVIDEQAEALASSPPSSGMRRFDLKHPSAPPGPGSGLAPGIRVSLDVLLPGEEVELPPSNASEVNFCIRGEGVSLVGDRKFSFGPHDVWNRPALAAARHRNEGTEPQVRLTYSNAPVLERLHVHVFPPEEQIQGSTAPRLSSGSDEREPNPFGDLLERSHPNGEDTLLLMPYEEIISPEVVPQRAWHWPWELVREELDKLAVLGQSYRGRRLYLMYNPATGRTHGTTNSFFATICLRPAGIVDRPHRHVSAAINYFFGGRGNSMVGGTRYEWKAGDLMFTAPGWMVHRHASDDEPVYELTVQDSPLHIALDSLLWQEDLNRPLRLLGSQEGFQTNVAAVT